MSARYGDLDLHQPLDLAQQVRLVRGAERDGLALAAGPYSALFASPVLQVTDSRYALLVSEAVLREVQARGRVYPSHGVWRGRQIIRISVSGYATQAEHADLAAHEIITAWRGLHAG